MDCILPPHKWGILCDHRRISSSPPRPHTSRKKHRKPSYDRVLDSQVMQAFHVETETSETAARSIKEENSSYESGEGGNILNMNRIKNLTKFS